MDISEAVRILRDAVDTIQEGDDVEFVSKTILVDLPSGEAQRKMSAIVYKHIGVVIPEKVGSPYSVVHVPTGMVLYDAKSRGQAKKLAVVAASHFSDTKNGPKVDQEMRKKWWEGAL